MNRLCNELSFINTTALVSNCLNLKHICRSSNASTAMFYRQHST